MPASASVVRAPSSDATGPVIANESGVRPIDTNQSKLDTRPSISAGTSVFMSVFQMIMPTVPRPNERTAIRHICHAAPATASPTSNAIPTVQAVHISVMCLRGRPVRLRIIAARIDPSPPKASTVPKVAASPSRSLRMM